MSQIAVSFPHLAPVGAGIQTLSDGVNPVVGPDGVGDINFVATGGLTIVGDALNSRITFGIAALGSQFNPDDGNNATPSALGVLDLVGTVNEIETLGYPTGGPYHGISFRLTQDVIIRRDLSVTRNLLVTGSASANSLAVATTCALTGHVTCNGGITNTGTFRSNAGEFYIDNLSLPVGVVQIDNTHRLYSSNGASGQLLIGRLGLNPVWSDLVSADNTVVITQGSGTIDIASGDRVATRFVAKDASVANPIGKSLTITGGTNISTTGSGSTIRISLNNSAAITGLFGAGQLHSQTDVVAKTGFLAVGGNITAAAGDLIASGDLQCSNVSASGNMTNLGNVLSSGTISSTNIAGGFISGAGLGNAAFGTINGNIVTTNGELSSNRTTTGNLTASGVTTLSALPVAGGVVQTSNTGILSSSVGANGQILVSGGAGPAWRNITAGAGITITNAANSITITNSGAGAVKSIFKSRYTADRVGITGDGFKFDFVGLTSTYDTTGCFNAATGTFTSLVDGYYQFSINVKLYGTAGLDIDLMNTETFFYRNGALLFKDLFMPQADDNGKWTIVSTFPCHMAVGQTMRFSISGLLHNAYPPRRSINLKHQYTFVSGHQIS
jgi:hypothetical protein